MSPNAVFILGSKPTWPIGASTMTDPWATSIHWFHESDDEKRLIARSCKAKHPINIRLNKTAEAAMVKLEHMGKRLVTDASNTEDRQLSRYCFRLFRYQSTLWADADDEPYKVCEEVLDCLKKSGVDLDPGRIGTDNADMDMDAGALRTLPKYDTSELVRSFLGLKTAMHRYIDSAKSMADEGAEPQHIGGSSTLTKLEKSVIDSTNAVQGALFIPDASNIPTPSPAPLSPPASPPPVGRVAGSMRPRFKQSQAISPRKRLSDQSSRPGEIGDDQPPKKRLRSDDHDQATFVLTALPISQACRSTEIVAGDSSERAAGLQGYPPHVSLRSRIKRVTVSSKELELKQIEGRLYGYASNKKGISLGTALIKAFEVSRLKHTEGLLRSFFATARGRLLRERVLKSLYVGLEELNDEDELPPDVATAFRELNAFIA